MDLRNEKEGKQLLKEGKNFLLCLLKSIVSESSFDCSEITDPFVRSYVYSLRCVEYFQRSWVDFFKHVRVAERENLLPPYTSSPLNYRVRLGGWEGWHHAWSLSLWGGGLFCFTDKGAQPPGGKVLTISWFVSRSQDFKCLQSRKYPFPPLKY